MPWAQIAPRAAGAALGLVVLGGLGWPGRTVRRLAVWGAAGLGVYAATAALPVPHALQVPINPYTVASAALLGAPGVGLAVFAHALFG